MTSNRIFCVFLGLYPPAFRREYAAAMAETFATKLGDCGPSARRRLLFVVRECAAVALGSAALRVAYAIGYGRGRKLRASTSGGDFLPSLTRDLRHASRSLMRKPGLAVSAVLTLGLGIGLATTIYPLPFWMELKVDAPVLLFVLTAVGISVLASGLVPALRASRTDVHATLTDTSWGNSSLRIGRISRLLVLAQITATALLLILACHLALQVSESRHAEYGYPTADVLTARVGLFDGAFPDRESRLEFYRELVRRLEDRPGVVAAALGTVLPGTQASVLRTAIQGHDYAEASDIPTARTAYVSPGFFDAFGTQPLEGRSFSASDDDDALPVAIVNQPFVERFFPDENAVGKQIRLGWPDPEGPWRTVVGVAPDLDMDGAVRPKGNPEGVYLPLAQADERFLSVAVRTRAAPLAFVPILRDEVAAMQSDTPVYFVQTLGNAINTNLLDLLLVGSLFGALAVAAFFLASVGLYGVTAFLTSQRTRELGIRVALGAKRGDVVRLVVRQGAVQVAIGLSLGVLLAAGSMTVMASGGMDTIPWNTLATGAVCLILAATALTAVFVPAWRAAEVDPVDALRRE